MKDFPPAAHGGGAARLARHLGRPVGDILDLSASLNPVAPDCSPIIGDHLDALGRYPDDDDATAALAESIGVDRERLVLTNGGAEAIALVAAEQPVGWADEFEFSLYRRHMSRLEPGGPRWVSDPHNPSGRLRPPDEPAAVRDEAFYVLATGEWTRGDPDAIVVGSLTKAFAVPGLRVGYVLAPDADLAVRIRARRPVWSVNGLVCAALPTLLELADPAGWRDGIARLRRDLVELLRGHGLAPGPSDANYVWIPDAAGVRGALAARSVLVRDGTSFGYPRAVRVAVPDGAGLDRLAAALAHLPDSPDPDRA